MRAIIVATVLVGAANAVAAPRSIELPAGFTEVPDAGAEQIGRLRALPTTVSVDAQVYLSADQSVQLTQLTWLSKGDHLPSRMELEELDDGTREGVAKQAPKHISDARRFVGNQMVSESIDEKDDIRVHSRRLYNLDSRGVVHIFTGMCAGAAEHLADCEKALQTMEQTLPDEMAFPAERAAPTRKRNGIAYLLGQITGGLLVLALVIWYVRRRRTRT